MLPRTSYNIAQEVVCHREIYRYILAKANMLDYFDICFY